MKLLVNTPDLGLPGGVAYYYKTIRPYFSEQVSYFTVGKKPGRNNKLMILLQLLFDYMRFIYVINRHGYQIVHVNPSLGHLSFLRDSVYIGIAKLCGKKVIVFFRGWDENYERFSVKYLRWLYRMTYFRSDAIIVLANRFKKTLVDLGYTRKVYTETTVVADEVFNQRDCGQKSLSPDRGSTILYLSRLEREKGIYELVDAMKILNQKIDNIKLVVAGSGSEEQNIKNYVVENSIDNVIFQGYITGDDKHRAFHQADIFAFPTYYGEGMPNAVLEAMAYGLPVLTRPVGGLGDFFEDGKMGFLVSEIDASVYADRLERLITDERLAASISEYNRQYATTHFKASVVVNRLEEIYRQVNT